MLSKNVHDNVFRSGQWRFKRVDVNGVFGLGGLRLAYQPRTCES